MAAPLAVKIIVGNVIGECVCGNDPCDGLDCGIYLPGRIPRKPYPKKSQSVVAEIRRRAWVTRRAKWGQHGHR